MLAAGPPTARGCGENSNEMGASMRSMRPAAMTLNHLGIWASLALDQAPSALRSRGAGIRFTALAPSISANTASAERTRNEQIVNFDDLPENHRRNVNAEAPLLPLPNGQALKRCAIGRGVCVF